MKNINEKKIPVQLVLFSFFGIILIYVLKEPYSEHLEEWAYCLKHNIDVPFYYFKIDFFGFEISYQAMLITLIIVMAFGVYWFLTKNDSEIKLFFSKNLNRVRSSDFYKSTIKRTSKITLKTNNDIKNKESDSELELNTTELKNRKKISLLKDISLISGVLLIALYFILNKYFDEQIANEIKKIPAYYNDTINYYNPANRHRLKASIIRNKYEGYFFILSIVVRIYSFFICWKLSKYNKGNYFIWGLLALVVPYISLLLAGVKFTLKKEYRSTL